MSIVGEVETIPAHLLDFSPLGLSVRTPREFPIGTIVRLSVGMDADLFHVTAVGRARVPGGFGAEFLAMTPIDQDLMRRLYVHLLRAASG